MSRVLAVVEGPTEQGFVERTLAPALSLRSVHVSARRIGKPGHKGGNKWESAQRDILDVLKQDPTVYCSTMFDYYGMLDDWPGRVASKSAPLDKRPETVEEAVAAEIAATMGGSFDRRRFIPYVQMHEFEAVLFSNVAVLADAIQRPDLAKHFQEILDEFGCPEAIDDSPQTAPSKRILAVVAHYKKPLHGNLAAGRIGLVRIQSCCPHFAEWVARLQETGTNA